MPQASRYQSGSLPLTRGTPVLPTRAISGSYFKTTFTEMASNPQTSHRRSRLSASATFQVLRDSPSLSLLNPKEFIDISLAILCHR